MIDVLSPSLIERDDFFSSQSLNIKDLKKELLRQKLADSRNRTASCKQRIDVILKEQAAMEHTAVLIKHEQEEIAREQEKLQERQLSLTQELQHVKQNHAKVQDLEATLSLTLNALVYCALSIYQDQRTVKKDLVKAEDKEARIQNHSRRIHESVPEIVQNLRLAWNKVRAIEDKAFSIQERYEVSELSLADIQERSDFIRANLPRLDAGSHAQKYEGSHAMGGTKKITQVEAAGLLKRIQDFCLLLVETACHTVLQVFQFIKPWRVKADFSIENPSLSAMCKWIALGALPITGLVEIHYSSDYLTLKGALIDLTVKC